MWLFYILRALKEENRKILKKTTLLSIIKLQKMFKCIYSLKKVF